MKKEDFRQQVQPDNLPAQRLVTPLVEGRDYYREGGFVVFTASFLLRRGACCRSGCRHCPYTEEVAK